MRNLFHSVSTLFVVVVMALTVVLFLGWARAPDMLAGSLAKRFKTDVTIDDIDLSLNSIEIEKIEVDNPPNSLLPKAFSAETIDIIAPLQNYLAPKLVIDLLRMDGVHIGLEFDAQGRLRGNWSILLSNLKTLATHKHDQRQVLIKKMLLSSITVELVYRDGNHKLHKLPLIEQLEFSDISSEGGPILDQLTHLICNTVLQELVNHTL